MKILVQYSLPSPHCKITTLILTFLLEEEALQSYTFLTANGEALHSHYFPLRGDTPQVAFR